MRAISLHGLPAREVSAMGAATASQGVGEFVAKIWLPGKPSRL
jgi:hypothetical protein